MNNLHFETITCPICNNLETKLMFKTKDYSYNNEGPFFIVKCKICTFVFQNPRPKFEFLSNYYPKGEYFTIPYSENEQQPIVNTIVARKNFLSNMAKSIVQSRYGYNYKQDGINSFIGKIINFCIGNLLVNLTYFQRPFYVENGRLLEVGFGTCSDLIQFRKQGWKTVGADVDRDCCKYASEKLQFEIANIDGYKIDYNDGLIDVIYLSQTLEHLSFLNECLLEYKRLLKVDGQLIMKFPNINCLQAKIWKSRWRGIEAPRHLSYFSKKTVKQLLINSGFKDITVRSVNLSPFDIFCSNIPPTIKNNQLHSTAWWNIRFIGIICQLFAPLFGLGESLYVTARK
jgi:SAM-dependent methyltransferase